MTIGIVANHVQNVRSSPSFMDSDSHGIFKGDMRNPLPWLETMENRMTIRKNYEKIRENNEKLGGGVFVTKV